MTRDEFWQMIETARLATNNDTDAQPEAIETALRLLPDDELISFHTHFDALYAPTYRMDLWGAAFLINGGCSDDCFDYFRAWLIGRGQAAYEAALANPDSLVEIAEEEDCEQEELLSIAIGVWLKRHGRDWSDLGKDSPFPSTPNSDLGPAEWDEEDEESLARLYPRLYEKFW
jgi:Protein of unknown function (DUF4240)